MLWIKFSHYKRKDRDRAKNDLIYLFEQFERQNGKNGYSLICEYVDAGAANIDLDLVLWMVDKLQKYFPHGMKKIIQIDMPQPITDLGPEIYPYIPELNNTMIFIPYKSLSQYIDPENYPTQYKTWLAPHPI